MASLSDLGNLLQEKSIPALKVLLEEALRFLIESLRAEVIRRKTEPAKKTYSIRYLAGFDVDDYLNEIFLATPIGKNFAHMYHRQIIHSTNDAANLLHFMQAYRRVESRTGIILDSAMLEEMLFSALNIRSAMGRWGIWADVYFGHNLRAGKIRKGTLMLMQALIIYAYIIPTKLGDFENLNTAAILCSSAMYEIGNLYDSYGDHMFDRYTYNSYFKEASK